MGDRVKGALLLGLVTYVVVAKVAYWQLQYRAQIRAIVEEKDRQLAAIDAAHAIVQKKIERGDYRNSSMMDIHRDRLFYIQMLREGMYGD